MSNDILWLDVVGFEGLYKVSNKGDIKNAMTNKMLKQGKNSSNYYLVILCKDRHKYTKKVHRLVAEAFIPNPENKPEVNHIQVVTKDCCNNCVDNLEWVTRKENYLHCKKLNRDSKPPIQYGKFNNASHQVVQKDINGNVVKIWECVREVSETFNIERHSLRNKILKKIPIKGYYFEYLEERGDDNADNGNKHD